MTEFTELEIPYTGVKLLLSRVHCGACFASKVLHQSTLNHYPQINADEKRILEIIGVYPRVSAV
jgi:hypothetical protein